MDHPKISRKFLLKRPTHHFSFRSSMSPMQYLKAKFLAIIKRISLRFSGFGLLCFRLDIMWNCWSPRWGGDPSKKLLNFSFAVFIFFVLTNLKTPTNFSVVIIILHRKTKIYTSTIKKNNRHNFYNFENIYKTWQFAFVDTFSNEIRLSLHVNFFFPPSDERKKYKKLK